MVVALVAAGSNASLTALVDNKPRSPADLAAAAGHAGIAAYLSESSLNSSLSSMSLLDQHAVAADVSLRTSAEQAGNQAVAQAAAVAAAASRKPGAGFSQLAGGASLDMMRGLGGGQEEVMEGMDETLAAIRRTAQAAAIIQGAKRKQQSEGVAEERGNQVETGAREGQASSEHMRLLDEVEGGMRGSQSGSDDVLAAAGISEEDVRTMVAAKRIQRAYRGHKQQKLSKAATLVQSKFRAWKKRNEFLHIKKNVIKIQVSGCHH